ncbi:hypothetical protein C806_00208 [Lachnospiraceae bacterium 3-1]|nr:hypothetical protein C806_00208 [Lachnospiraceae bacterium 3-1]
MQQVEFQVGAKTARLIGRENIADVDGALIELIKNAYDADATCVYVDFFMPFPDIPDRAVVGDFSDYLSESELFFVQNCYEQKKGEWIKKRTLSEQEQDALREILFSHNRIIVADNGSGMSLDIVKNVWMYIGTSNKEYNSMSDKGRIKTGAKGIGRFALDKLSTQSVMYTKDRTAQEVLIWGMDWEQFENAKLIGDVKAQLDFSRAGYRKIVEKMLGEKNPVLAEHNWSTGTLIQLAPIREAWSMRLFQKVNANLKSINPIGSADRFEVIVNNHFFSEYNYQTEEVSIDGDDYDYRIKAEYDGRECLSIRLLRNEVNLSKKYITVEKYETTQKRSLEEFWTREKLQRKGYQKEDYDKEITIKRNVQDILPLDGLEKIQRVGPFTAEMYFLRNMNNEHAIMKKVAVKKRKNLLNQFSGVKLYRDNFKVRPYGDVGAMYDWIGMSERAQKSSISVANQTGSWRVQPYQMIGLVKIGRESNPYLEDMANREGIALTDTYYIFVSLLQECLKEFEFDRQYIYREYAKWVKTIEDEMAGYKTKIMLEASRRAESFKRNAKVSEKVDQVTSGEEESGIKQKNGFSEEEMFDTVYEIMKESERELNSKQIQQILSSSGIMLNTFFHEFNAINTQFHVEASQIRSRINYILKGKGYEGLAAYNPYSRIDSLERNDMVTAAFLDVIMDGLKKENLKVQNNSLKKMLMEILSKWEVLLKEKHILIRLVWDENEKIKDDMPIALVDMYIILNNFILNSAWFLEQEHNQEREISFSLKEAENELYFLLENNGPVLAEKYRGNPDKIFELGETSKEGKGTGLGLWVVKETVERNDGTISVMDKPKGFGLKIIWKKGDSNVSNRYNR